MTTPPPTVPSARHGRPGHRRAARRLGAMSAAFGAAAALVWAAAPAATATTASSGSATGVRSSALGAVPAARSAGVGHTLIQGSGSSWAANAVNQWIADVGSSGLQVVFTSTGSAQGRKDFANNTVDFAVSDIGYQGVDPTTGLNDTSQGRQFAYLPIVAGGTSLPYQIIKNGQQVRNLRLSGETLAKIFTNKITNWDDPEITKDNNGNAMPNLPIIPVVHSEGSGSTYQFTRYLATQYPSIWKPYSGLGATEYFPAPQGNQVAENGSDSVINFVSSSAGNGAIGYDEYSYALGKNYPVAKLLNTAGYYTLPNQYNVAVALTKAQINTNKSSPDYLLQNLDKVYTYGDPRVYPMSSYSYAVIPTSASDPKMTSAKRQTLADYLDFSVCQGQQQMGPIGYSPLPINLVQASFDQVAKLHAADKNVDVTQAKVTSCNNPTFVAGNPTENYLAQIAPQPQSCDKVGAGPCLTDGNTGQVNPPSSGGGGTTPGGTTGSGGGGGTSHHGGHGGGGTSSGGGGTPAPGATTPATGGTTAAVPGGIGTLLPPTIASGGSSSPSASTTIDPVTGQQVAAGVPAGGAVSGGTVVPVATVLPSSHSSTVNVVLVVLAALLLLALLVVPPFVAHRVSGRRGPVSR